MIGTFSNPFRDLVVPYKKYETGSQMSLVSRGGRGYATRGANELALVGDGRTLGSGGDGTTIWRGVQCGFKTGCNEGQ